MNPQTSMAPLEDVNRGGQSRKAIMQEVEASLKRLGTDYIDLYQIHVSVFLWRAVAGAGGLGVGELIFRFPWCFLCSHAAPSRAPLLLSCTLSHRTQRFDYNTPVEEVMRTLDDLIRIGKVRYIGASSMYVFPFSLFLLALTSPSGRADDS